MEKIVAIPSLNTGSGLEKHVPLCMNYLSNLYWNYRCKDLTYQQLLQKTVLTIEMILQAHLLKNHFYQNLNFEVTLRTKNGWSMDISKAYYNLEENILAILYKETDFGQITHSITFENKNGNILGIQNMFQGFCVDSYFYDKESEILNPNVLAAFLTAKNHLCSGTIHKLKSSNKPIPWRDLII